MIHSSESPPLISETDSRQSISKQYLSQHDIFSYSVKRFRICIYNAMQSRYLAACLVYLAYAIAMVYVSTSYVAEGHKDSFYFQFAIVHLINSVMFAWAWSGRPWTDKVLFPDYLNMIGASLYLWSSTLYGKEYESDDYYAGYSKEFYLERWLEFAASLIELFASFGWFYVWYIEYAIIAAQSTRPIASKGWTFDDPDAAANITIITASIIYFTYNCQVCNNYSDYETNTLYKLGDHIYCANAVFYVLAALRDAGFFWFMPEFGVYKSVAEIIRDNESSFTDENITKSDNNTVNSTYY